jgi:DNA adenine methylase
LVDILKNYLPKEIAALRYHEPFLGAGSLFFSLKCRSASLADANRELIDVYRWIREAPELVHRHLMKLSSGHNVATYYTVRSDFNRCRRDTAIRSARFIYLNKTCFNGIYRVNMKGQFNVPFGRKDPMGLPTSADLLAISKSLRGANLSAQGFEESLEGLEEGDFAYLDPPYPALNSTAYFVHYTRRRFDWQLQKDLACQVRALDKKGARFLLTIADTRETRTLYKGFKVYTTSVTRFVTCKKAKASVQELIIRNY